MCTEICHRNKNSFPMHSFAATLTYSDWNVTYWEVNVSCSSSRVKTVGHETDNEIIHQTDLSMVN